MNALCFRALPFLSVLRNQKYVGNLQGQGLYSIEVCFFCFLIPCMYFLSLSLFTEDMQRLNALETELRAGFWKKKKKIVFIIEFSKGGLSFIQRSQSALCASETTTEPVWTMEFIDLVCLLSSWKSPHHLDYFWLKQTCPNFYFLIGKRALKWRLVTT